ncbi:hypothetical protein GPDM_14256 [Planococcus donghaensis MPA1U2]|uniref:Uncharacterized protein n=1 Tax=Planococcus donghaensis MPA1U2 TaxID=933115 RepID=E7RK31_9BACL|nr:hypothetical protein GPDM_14256 [Planococcus donghaensis MPA1U2]
MEKNLIFSQADFMYGVGGASILTAIVFLMTTI